MIICCDELAKLLESRVPGPTHMALLSWLRLNIWFLVFGFSTDSFGLKIRVSAS